jgi:DNA-binding MarR family transcriptional regulator
MIVQKRSIMLLSMKMKMKVRRPPPMTSTAIEVLDLLFWKVHRILDLEGVSILQWAFMHRAFLHESGVAFNAILKATGDSKDNVRRAARALEKANIGRVTADPSDGRARIFVLTKLGRRRTLHLWEAIKAELLASVGAREIFSKRAERFTRHMWHASMYLASGDLASKETTDDRDHNRVAVPDNSLRYVEVPKKTRSLFVDSREVPF